MSDTSWFLDDDFDGLRDAMRESLKLGPDNLPLPKAPSLYECVRFLAGHDLDRARVINGVGFNKFDGDPGHRLANKPEREWTEWDNFNAYKLIFKYKDTQLIPAGLRFDLIVAPTEPKASPPLRVVTDAEDGFNIKVHFEHLPDAEYARVRNAAWKLPSIKWAGSNTFTITKDAPSITPLVQFVLEYDFTIAPEFLKALQDIVQASERILMASKGTSLKAIGITDWKIKPGYSLTKRNGSDFTPRPFQEVGVWYIDTLIRQRHHGVMVCDEMGLGKTTEVLLAAHHMFTEEDWRRGLLILCPTHLARNWEDEVRDRLPERTVTRLESGRMQAIGTEIVICPYSILRYQLVKETGKSQPNEILFQLQIRPWAGIACDESHYLKNEDAMRTSATQELFKQSNPWFRIGMSGSPVLNRAPEFTPQLELLGMLKEFGTKYSFEREAAWKPVELNARMREKGLLRREKTDVLTCKCPDRSQYEKDTIACKVCGGLPIKQREVVLLDLDPAARKRYDYAQEAFRKWLLEEYKGDMEKWVKSMRAEILVKIEKLSHELAMAKLKPFIEWHESFLESSDQKIVMFAHHVDAQEKLLEAFPESAAILGSQSMSDNMKYRNEIKFQTDPTCRTMVYTTLGATGRNLTACSNTSFLELEWGPMPHDQAEDRCHRIGSERMVNSRFFLVENTIDSYRMAMIDAKRRITSAINKGEVVDDSSLLSGMLLAFIEGRSPDADKLAETYGQTASKDKDDDEDDNIRKFKQRR